MHGLVLHGGHRSADGEGLARSVALCNRSRRTAGDAENRIVVAHSANAVCANLVIDIDQGGQLHVQGLVCFNMGIAQDTQGNFLRLRPITFGQAVGAGIKADRARPRRGEVSV